jgi:hypothetical protein
MLCKDECILTDVCKPPAEDNSCDKCRELILIGTWAAWRDCVRDNEVIFSCFLCNSTE